MCIRDSKAAKGRRNVRRDRFSSPDTGMKARVEEVTERALERRNRVLRRLEEEGMFPADMVNRALQEPLFSACLLYTSKQVKLSDVGTFDLDFTFPGEETGTYSVLASLRLKGDSRCV